MTESVLPLTALSLRGSQINTVQASCPFDLIPSALIVFGGGLLLNGAVAPIGAELLGLITAVEVLYLSSGKLPSTAKSA